MNLYFKPEYKQPTGRYDSHKKVNRLLVVQDCQGAQNAAVNEFTQSPFSNLKNILTFNSFNHYRNFHLKKLQENNFFKAASLFF